MSVPETTGRGCESPFDQIRQTRPDGSEFWSARDLQQVMNYTRWSGFKIPLERAMKAAENQGHDVGRNFQGSAKVSGERGPASEDFHLTRFAAYLVAMNGDPNKAQVAEAQAYFAIQTRIAETAPAPFALPQSMSEALRLAADQFDRAELEAAQRRQLAAKVEHDAPMLAKAEAHSASTTSINRQDFAREVQTWGKKIHGIWILQKHVMAFLAHKGVTVRGDRSDAGQATATAIRNGWAENSKYTDETTGRTFVTTRLLPKGQDLAWKWITSHVEANGTLELPRDLRAGDAA
ncbi:phage antirepressor KilAC domain-containing protein [Rhodococcus pyridinivorans]|uniref:phage antirepressor KilAC domain-containing protein n=1 Tax=Rhodococcus pyridinivorans TaxID=103816 RepID=UPI003D7F40AD